MYVINLIYLSKSDLVQYQQLINNLPSDKKMSWRRRDNIFLFVAAMLLVRLKWNVK